MKRLVRLQPPYFYLCTQTSSVSYMQFLLKSVPRIRVKIVFQAGVPGDSDSRGAPSHQGKQRNITPHPSYDILYLVLFCGLLLGCTLQGRVINGHTRYSTYMYS